MHSVKFRGFPTEEEAREFVHWVVVKVCSEERDSRKPMPWTVLPLDIRVKDTVVEADIVMR